MSILRNGGLLSTIAVCLVIAALIILVAESILRARKRHERQQVEHDWADMTTRVRSTLSAPGRDSVIQNVILKAHAQQARLDQICRITADTLDAPAAVITVVEVNGQRWLAHYGATWCDDETRAGLIQPLSTSYCQYVVTTDQPLIVMDSLKDVRLKSADGRTLHAVRAYIGAPVHAPDGTPVGSLCVFDAKPRKWTRRDRAVVEVNADLVTL